MEPEVQAEIDSLKANLAAIQVLRRRCHRVAFLADACGINMPFLHCLMTPVACVLVSMRGW